MWRNLGQSLRSIRKNRVRNGSWAFEQIKCNHQVQISKIDQNRTLRGAKIFLRILTQILGFLTHSYAVLFCSQPGFWAALIFLRILTRSLGFLTQFLGFHFSSFLCCLVRHLAVIELLFAVKKMGSERWVGDLIFFFAFFGQASISTKAIRLWKGNHSEIVSPDPLGLVWAARPAQKVEISAAKV